MVSEAGGWMEWNGEVLILFLWSETDVINKKSLKTYTYLYTYTKYFIYYYDTKWVMRYCYINYFYFELKFVFVVINTQ